LARDVVASDDQAGHRNGRGQGLAEKAKYQVYVDSFPMGSTLEGPELGQEVGSTALALLHRGHEGGEAAGEVARAKGDDPAGHGNRGLFGAGHAPWYRPPRVRAPNADQLDDFCARFAAATIPKDEWTHGAHLAVGLWHVHHYGPEQALDRLRAGIRRLNDSHGTPNTATSGYHETVTCAYVALLAAFLASGEGRSLTERYDELLAGPLAAADVLLGHYSRERLFAADARASWVEPDLAPLPVARLRLP
jgi:hypothetical protein